MDGALRAAVAALIEERTHQGAHIVASRPAGGGCIHRAEVVELADGRCYFVKSNPAPLPEGPPGGGQTQLFKREAEGLAALAAAEAIRVPRPIGAGGAEPGAVPFLLTEAIATGSRREGFSAVFGRRFARLHRANGLSGAEAIDHFGFDHDNYLGSTPQPNAWTGDWTDFWRRHRLGHQLALARRNGVSDSTIERLGDRLLNRLDELIGEPEEPPCLLHGDLWGGNYMVDEAGDPVLIDPAVYFGRREADLAMTMLFGGFDARFYAAYEEAWPLAPGARDRLEVYKLYHLLNHLNLFGRGYRDACVAIMKRFV